MTFEILSKTDLSTGAMLTVRFPEEDFDEKAYYTIENDMPDFLVPFRCHSVDGQIECTYQLGSLVKLQYHYTNLSPNEYAQFWKQVLQPFFDCDDWFLKPFSFVMDTRYLYTDRDGEKISYLYIPAKSDWGSPETLKTMAIELAQKNPVTDPMLENQTLRAMMQEFRPKEFLQMTQAVRREAPAPAVQPVQQPTFTPAATPVSAAAVPVQTAAPAKPAEVEETPKATPVSAAGNDDIFINLDGSGAKEPEKKKGWSLFGGKKDKPAEEPKAPKEPKEKRSLFGGKKNKSKEIIIGAGEEDPARMIEARAEQPAAAAPAVPVAPVWIPQQEEDEHTKLDEDIFGPHLRLIGEAHLPGNITVTVEQGRPFTIGRYDVSVGRRQSDFEFDKGTKAVSRRHAAIEKDGSGYWIVDLASSAGTFVNGERLQPNVPRQLTRGCRISFGTGGADYIWEE